MKERIKKDYNRISAIIYAESPSSTFLLENKCKYTLYVNLGSTIDMPDILIE
jgi:hypothetical protein